MAKQVKIDKYTLTKLLGKGSFGAAYLCHADSKQYVMKRINLGPMEEKDRKNAIQEVELLRKISSWCVVKYIDAFFQGNKLSIVMEYCNDGDLESLIKTRKKNNDPFSEEGIKNIICQVMIALVEIHAINIVHRDVKAGNIFLCKGGFVKLGDFGISKQLQDRKSMAETTIGTPYNLSPEIVKGEPYDRKSDIWALGVVVYEMMNFQLPYLAENRWALAKVITDAKHEPLSPKYSGVFRQLTESMLAQNPQERPEAIEALKHKSMSKVYAEHISLINTKLHLPDELKGPWMKPFLSPSYLKKGQERAKALMES